MEREVSKLREQLLALEKRLQSEQAARERTKLSNRSLQAENRQLQELLDGWKAEAEKWKTDMDVVAKENKALRSESVPKAEHDALSATASRLVEEIAKLSNQLRVKFRMRSSPVLLQSVRRNKRLTM